MEKHPLKPYIVVVSLMAMTSLALAVSVDVSITNEAGVRMDIPFQVGNWEGKELLFCQDVACQEANQRIAGEAVGLCSKCETGELGPMSLLEKQLLPPDTGMVRKQFVERDTGQMVNASIVLSGKERGSIHRPEMCQTGQGRKLTRKVVVEVPIEGRKPLKVMVLELERTVNGRGGAKQQIGSYYAYWFVGKNRETAHHHMRMLLMASDRVLHNIAHRWAYISVAGTRQIGSDDYQEQVREFVADFYPHVAIGQS